MEINQFIKDFANQFDDTELEVFTPETNYRELDEWSSLVALAVLNMCVKKYQAQITPAEMRATTTVQQLFDLVASKQ